MYIQIERNPSFLPRKTRQRAKENLLIRKCSLIQGRIRFEIRKEIHWKGGNRVREPSSKSLFTIPCEIISRVRVSLPLLEPRTFDLRSRKERVPTRRRKPCFAFSSTPFPPYRLFCKEFSSRPPSCNRKNIHPHQHQHTYTHTHIYITYINDEK